MNTTRHNRTLRETHYFTFAEPVAFHDHSISSLSVWWDRALPDGDWTVSLGCTVGSFPYRGNVLLSRNIPELLTVFLTLIEETRPVDDIARRLPAGSVTVEQAHTVSRTPGDSYETTVTGPPVGNASLGDAPTYGSERAAAIARRDADRTAAHERALRIPTDRSEAEVMIAKLAEQRHTARLQSYRTPADRA